MESKYYKDGITRVLDLMKDTFGTNIKRYFNGDPENILDEEYPAIIVTETDGTITSGPTGTDLVTENILITIAMNARDDIGAESDIELTDFKIRKLVKGQNPDTGEYEPMTVMYALRKHITMNSEVLSASVRTRFDELVPRGENNIDRVGYVELTIQRHIRVPSRD